jgi:hypothetical protein
MAQQLIGFEISPNMLRGLGYGETREQCIIEKIDSGAH